jgi:hypothetical protein
MKHCKDDDPIRFRPKDERIRKLRENDSPKIAFDGCECLGISHRRSKRDF